MTELSLTRLWAMRLGFALLAAVILFFRLLPLDTAPRSWAGPDLLLCFAAAWVLRRPEYVPALLLAAIFLLADLLLQRPPGLWAALALIGCEKLKSRARTLRDTGFAGEWFSVCLMVVIVTLAYRAALVLTLTEPPTLGLHLFAMVMTMLFYPLAVAATHGLMGVRKTVPGELDAVGGRM
ncbi:rod shape-determining protein MreD [Sulfitobacter sp. D35]|uniref:rod shape-determining protein MreD n=1 Tax=Sulfitobacter sp. D35 TaxID=3083252 RepID=UPI00296F89C5|nr:rod shape-determining protein MreD [Sulfitobacter sp. D35]MDW4500123.1 rod shape-determining protein MreD [Sulfitobacter sp. D35]